MLDLGPVFENDITVYDSEFDRLNAAVERMLSEAFPDTATDSLSRFEKRYKIDVPEGTSISRRRQIIASHEQQTNSMSRGWFERAAIAMGYNDGSGKTLRFVEGAFPPFRVGISRVGIDRISGFASGTSIVTVVVSGTGVATDSALHLLFSKRKCKGTEFIYLNE